jgi:hypothetical protein
MSISPCVFSCADQEHDARRGGEIAIRVPNTIEPEKKMRDRCPVATG